MTYVLAQASAHRIPVRDESVQCVVTSPPYWGLRAYAGEQSIVWGGDSAHEHEWSDVRRIGGGRQNLCECGAWCGALGLEPAPSLYLEHMVEVFREVRRVLRRDGTVWLNLGDSYAASRSGPIGASTIMGEKHHAQHESRKANDAAGRPNRRWSFEPWGLKPKSLIGMPWRVALALQEDGWLLRSEIIWNKPNPMPDSVRDRPTRAHEQIFLLSKSGRYYYDRDAILEPFADERRGRDGSHLERERNRGGRADGYTKPNGIDPSGQDGRNARTVWTIPAQPYPGAHFATFPEAIPEKCIKAGTKPGDVVLDPFNGSGTTGRVAMRLGRRYVGLDLSLDYLTGQAIARVDPLTAARRSFDAGEASQAVLL